MDFGSLTATTGRKQNVLYDMGASGSNVALTNDMYRDDEYEGMKKNPKDCCFRKLTKRQFYLLVACLLVSGKKFNSNALIN